MTAGDINQVQCMCLICTPWLKETMKIYIPKYTSISVKVKLLSHVQLFATLWTVAYQAPLSMEFSRQEHWTEVPLPSPKGNGPEFKSLFDLLQLV